MKSTFQRRVTEHLLEGMGLITNVSWNVKHTCAQMESHCTKTKRKVYLLETVAWFLKSQGYNKTNVTL
uniref:Uncharacterized protein n=1 Tax=Octopus bimaculoides TaxID=37653 RepID=A0A0L8GQS6_OCTBM